MPSPHSQANPSKIFITYRRSESAAHAGRLSDQLTAHFGSQIIFIDIESIEPGRDFVEAIEDAVSSCKILLVVIGQQWLTCTNEHGRRLDDSKDFVRLEIAAALKRGIRVIPVLVQGATMPREQDLPDEIAPLARRQAWEVSDLRWRQDVGKLIQKIGGDIPPRPNPLEKAYPQNKRVRYALYVLIVLATVIGLLGLRRRTDVPLPDNTGPIKVGVYADLSGQTFAFGQSTVNGIKMAIEEITKAGGLDGRQIDLLIADNQGVPSQTAVVVNKLINQDGVHAVLGDVFSANSLAAAPIAQEAKIPMIVSATNPVVTNEHNYIFRIGFIDPFQGQAMARFASESLRAKTAAFLLNYDSDYSFGIKTEFERIFGQGGGAIVATKAYADVDGDFRVQLTSIRSANPDVIFVPGYYGQVGVIAKQAKELGIKAPLLGGDGWDAPQLWELGGAALNGSYMASHYSVDDPAPAAQKFAADYRARFNMYPDAMAALGYDAVKVLADSIKRAGTTERQKLRDAISQTEGFPGVTGSIKFDSHRNAIKPVVVLKLHDGKFLYQETVQP